MLANRLRASPRGSRPVGVEADFDLDPPGSRRLVSEEGRAAVGTTCHGCAS